MILSGAQQQLCLTIQLISFVNIYPPPPIHTHTHITPHYIYVKLRNFETRKFLLVLKKSWSHVSVFGDRIRF